MKAFLKSLLLLVGLGTGLVVGLIGWVMFDYTPVSEWAGGKGTVLLAGQPVENAQVFITDEGGTLTANTDRNGRFDIPVESEKMLYLAMANPDWRKVEVRVDLENRPRMRWTFSRKRLGWNYFDFGTIDIAPDAAAPGEPKYIHR